MKKKILNKYCVKNSKKSEKGITIATLVVTIVVLFIISSTIISISTEEFDKAELKGFYSKLEIAQEGIEKIARTNESYKDESGNTIYLKDTGENLTAEHETLISDLGYSTENFSYFTSEKIEKELNIHGVDLDLLINFKDCIVISVQGIESEGNMIYTLENQKYTIEYSGDKNVGSVDFNYTISKYGNDFYKLIIEPINIGDINTGIVKYKKIDLNYWTVAEDNEIIINQLTEYDIIYVDANNNSIQKKLSISLDEDGNVKATEVVE